MSCNYIYILYGNYLRLIIFAIKIKKFLSCLVPYIFYTCKGVNSLVFPNTDTLRPLNLVIPCIKFNQTVQSHIPNQIWAHKVSWRQHTTAEWAGHQDPYVGWQTTFYCSIPLAISQLDKHWSSSNVWTMDWPSGHCGLHHSDDLHGISISFWLLVTPCYLCLAQFIRNMPPPHPLHQWCANWQVIN